MYIFLFFYAFITKLQKRPHFATREEMCIFHDLDYVKYLELVGEKVESMGVGTIPGTTELKEYEKNLLYNETKKCFFTYYFLINVCSFIKIKLERSVTAQNLQGSLIFAKYQQGDQLIVR